MTGSVVIQPKAWHTRGWWLSVVFVFLAHVGLIVWLSEPNPARPRRPAFVPELKLAATGSTELLALADPTLFALPHPEGLSGMAWLTMPPPRHASFDWSEEPRWLTPGSNTLWESSISAPETNFAAAWQKAAMPRPELLYPRLPRLSEIPQTSALRFDSALTSWRWANPTPLPSWPARPVSATDTDLLTNSIVQVMLNADGTPVSVTLLSSSGLSAADEFALNLARRSRFEPPPSAPASTPPGTNALSHLKWGRLIFEWHTVPATNSAARPAP